MIKKVFIIMFSMDSHTQRAIAKYPDRALDIAKSYEQRKVNAKTRLVNRLRKCQIDNKSIPNPIERINIVGGWYGNVLIPLLDSMINFKEINFYELDAEALSIAQNIFFPNRFNITWIHADATMLDFTGNDKLTINTSCEHMTPLKIDTGYVALQSNDYIDVEDHINCVDSPEELAEQYNLSKVWYSDSKDYISYRRFSVIGRI